MDINLLLKGKKCDCGKMHCCDIEHVYIEDNAILRLKDLCRNYSRILLVADENTFSAAGEKTEAQLRDKVVRKVIFSGKTVLIPNETAIQQVQESLLDSDLIIGIGSGVIQDLCKYVSFFEKVPYMVVATAPSMDGYASDGAAMILKGMKETVKAGLPRAIVADTEVLKDAPMDMIQAGYGDIVGKYSSLCDWKLSHLINGEYFCQWIYDMTFDMIEKTVAVAESLKNRETAGVKVLMEALTIVGILISFAGSSRPASGSEHHLSHFFEIVGIVRSEPYFPHGIDVAYSAIITTKLRDMIASHPFPETIFRLDRDAYCQKMADIYGPVAEGCIALQDRMGHYAADRLPIYQKYESEIRNLLTSMPNSQEIMEILSRVGLDISAFFELYSEEKIKQAIRYAKDLKDRYTVLWVYYDLFGENVFELSLI